MTVVGRDAEDTQEGNATSFGFTPFSPAKHRSIDGGMAKCGIHSSFGLRKQMAHAVGVMIHLRLISAARML